MPATTLADRESCGRNQGQRRQGQSGGGRATTFVSTQYINWLLCHLIEDFQTFNGAGMVGHFILSFILFIIIVIYYLLNSIFVKYIIYEYPYIKFI